jgi:cyclohexadienyl dehydratase
MIMVPQLFWRIMRGLCALRCTQLFVVLTMLAPAAWAGDRLDRILKDSILRVGTTGDYKPYSFRMPDGTYVGADVIMARRLADQLGLNLKIIPTSWKSLVDDLKADKFDIAMGGISILPDRMAVGAFTIPVQVDGKRPIVRCADKDRFTSIGAIDKPTVTVIANEGASNETFARQSFPRAQLIISQSNVNVTDAIIRHRADVMVTDGAEVDHLVRFHSELCGANVDAPFTRLEKAYLLQNDKDFLAVVNSWLADQLSSQAWAEALESEQQKP